MTFVWSYCKNLTLRLLEQLEKLEIQKTDKHENKVTENFLLGAYEYEKSSSDDCLGHQQAELPGSKDQCAVVQNP